MNGARILVYEALAYVEQYMSFLAIEHMKDIDEISFLVLYWFFRLIYLGLVKKLNY